MVIQLQSPGVYREELFGTPPPELATGVPVFLGYASQGAVNEPQPLALWSQFASMFGIPVADGYLAQAAHGFLSNGGTFCYVLRLSDTLPFETSVAEGLEAIAPLEDIDLVCVPDLMRGSVQSTLDSADLERVQRLQQLVLEHCDRLGDRFAILDAVPSMDTPVEQAKDNIQQQIQGLRGTNGALYAPWLQNNRGEWVPPCGHVAGVYGKRDRALGVHQAPANEVLEDVLDLSVRFSDADQAALNRSSDGGGVNCVRSLPGRGIRIWGARTLSREPRWQYVGVRRLFLTVGRWVEQNLAAVAFEPNNIQLWIQIERELTTYLESLARQGALQGSTPQEAFYIKCDAETNPPEVRDGGQVVTEIGLAPTVPNEFIVVRLVHGTSGIIANNPSAVPP